MPEGTEGKKTRCPHCQSVIEIPAAGSSPVERPTEQRSFTPAPGGFGERGESPRSESTVNPFGESGTRSPLPEDPQANNPYASGRPDVPWSVNSESFSERRRADARQKLMIPAAISLALLVVGMALCLLVVVAGLVVVGAGEADDEDISLLIVFVVTLALQIPTLIGLLSATIRWNYVLAWMGFICALIPCTNACSFTLLPIGIAIWGIVVMTDPAVRQQFRS